MNINDIIKCTICGVTVSSGSQLFMLSKTPYLKAIVVLLLNDETDCLHGCIDIYSFSYSRSKNKYVFIVLDRFLAFHI